MISHARDEFPERTERAPTHLAWITRIIPSARCCRYCLNPIEHRK
jgi:hypothetical protein